MTSRRWTDDEIALIEAGLPDAEVARLTGRRVRAVGEFRRIRLRKVDRITRAWTPDEDATVLDRPRTVEQIATLLGRSNDPP